MVVVSAMLQHADFEDLPRLTRHLAGELNRGRLALVLGAGASDWYGLPSWDDLVTRLYKSTSLDEPSKATMSDVRDRAENLMTLALDGDEERLASLVERCLYKDAHDNEIKVDFERLRSDHLLAAVGALVMASRRGNISQVITLNYDNILEVYLRLHGLVVNSVGSEPSWATNADVNVYHPHGLLPIDSTGASKQIVLTKRSYSQRVGRSELPWNRLCMSVLEHRTCLFVGLSGNDDNLDALMLSALAEHPALRESVPYWGVAFGKADAATKWQSRGVFYHRLGDYSELPAILFGICQDAATLAGS